MSSGSTPERLASSPLLMILEKAAEDPSATAFLRRAPGGFAPLTFAELDVAVREIAAGLIDAGLEPGGRVLLLSETRIEWGLADLAVLAAGAADVPLYPSVLTPQVRAAWEDSGSTMAFVSSREQLAKLREATHGRTQPELIVAFDAKAARDGAIALSDLRTRGRRALETDPGLVEARLGAIHGATLASIVYTSGTTGRPKGVLLSHANFAANVAAMGAPFPVGPGDVALGFLPLSHVLERTAGLYGFLHKGVAIAYARSIQSLPQDLTAVRPTVLVAVPRVFQKLRNRVFEAVRQGSWLRRRLFAFAVRTGRAWSRRMEHQGRVPWWLRWAHALADRLVFRKLRHRIGGRLTTVFCGGAPLGAQLPRFFHAAGIMIYEGYGLTETAPVIAVNTPTAWRFGSVGRRLPNVDVRIAEDGEICVRGPSVTQGYHQRPAETAALFDTDGWLRTGDLGRVDDDGFLHITGRKKELLVTSGGKKVAPSQIEDPLRAEPTVAEAVCCGEGQPYLTALIVPEAEAIDRLLPGAGPEAVRAHFAELIARLQADQPRFNRIRRFWLLDEPFTEAGGELTPTQKVRRAAVMQKYADAVARLYAGGGTVVLGEERRDAERERPAQRQQ